MGYPWKDINHIKEACLDISHKRKLNAVGSKNNYYRTYESLASKNYQYFTDISFITV